MNEVSVTVRKRKDSGKYQAIISVKQGNKWKQVESKGGFTSNLQANNWATPKAAEWQKKIANDYEDLPIGRLKEIYLEDLKETVAESTYLQAKFTINKFDKFDQQTIKEITPYMYREYKKTIPYSYMSRLSAFYNYLIKELEIKTKNPYKPTHKPEEKKKIVSHTDYLGLLATIKNEDVRLACKIIYNTGLRIGEVSGLTTKDITKDHIRVNKQLNQRTKKISNVKSKNSKREVPITEELYKEIMQNLKQKKILSINQRIFSQKNPSMILSHIRRRYTKGTKYEKITFHHLRHTYITNLVISGLDLLTVAYIAGDDLNTITKTYIHLTRKNYDIAKDFIQNKKVLNI